MHSPTQRKQAEQLRRKGYSYSMIAEQLRVPKGTLHWWLRDIPYSPNRFAQLRKKEGFAHSAKSRSEQAAQAGTRARNDAHKQIGALSSRDLLVAGAALFAQQKVSPSLFSSDNAGVVRLALQFLRTSLEVDEQHLAPFVQLSARYDEKKAVAYWSEVARILPAAFGSTRRIAASARAPKRKERPYGTLHIGVRSCGKRHFRVELEQRIRGYIDALMGE